MLTDIVHKPTKGTGYIYLVEAFDCEGLCIYTHSFVSSRALTAQLALNNSLVMKPYRDKEHKDAVVEFRIQALDIDVNAGIIYKRTEF